VSWQYWRDFIPLEEAVELSGAHAKTIKRLLIRETLRGDKKVIAGRKRWMVERRSLHNYFNPYTGFALDIASPKLFLTRQGRTDADPHLYRVTVHNYDSPTLEEEYSIQQEAFTASSIREAAETYRQRVGRWVKILVVRIEKQPFVLKNGEWAISY
jgi:hypothetical protein